MNMNKENYRSLAAIRHCTPCPCNQTCCFTSPRIIRLKINPTNRDTKKQMRGKTFLLGEFRVSVNCCTWPEQLYAQENKFGTWTGHIKVLLKPCRVEQHALSGLSTHEACQKGSSIQRCGNADIWDIQPPDKSLECQSIRHWLATQAPPVSIYQTFTPYASPSSVDISDIHSLHKSIQCRYIRHSLPTQVHPVSIWIKKQEPVNSCSTYTKLGRTTDTDFAGKGEVTFPPTWWMSSALTRNVICWLLLSRFNQNWNVLVTISRTPWYQISWKSI
jgi:hypothetical protein